ARQQVANLAFAHEFQRGYRDHSERPPDLSISSGSRGRADPDPGSASLGLDRLRALVMVCSPGARSESRGNGEYLERLLGPWTGLSAASLAFAARESDLNPPGGHVGIFLLAHEVDLGRPVIGVAGKLPHLVHRSPVVDGVVDRCLRNEWMPIPR